MTGLGGLRSRLGRLWLISPERLWAFSRTLQQRDRWMLAFAVKQLNTILYHNSLSPAAIVGSNVLLGHYSHGIVVNSNVEIGDDVKIWHNVTLTAGRPERGERPRSERTPSRIVIEDGVKIGTNAVVIPARGQCLRIGRGARIGAGVTVTQDVPARATVVSPPPRILLRDQPDERRTLAAPDSQASGPAVPFANSSDAAIDSTPPSESRVELGDRPPGDATARP